MSYSFTGFSGTDCTGSATAGQDYQSADARAKSSCGRAVQLRQIINRLKPIVDDQGDETTQEKVDYFNAQKELPVASRQCDADVVAKNVALKRFIAFQSAGCYGGAAPPVRTGTTTVERVREKQPGVIELPEVVIRGDQAPPKPKYVGPSYSASNCPPNPARTSQGQKGQGVFCWQRFLASQGFSLAADGDHGSITEAASKQYEAKTAKPIEPPKPVVEPPKPAIEPSKPVVASTKTDEILGIPRNYALVGFAAVAAAGAYWYYTSQEG